jgi:hypothetical protein
MNTRKLIVSVLMLVFALISACAPATQTPPPTEKLLSEHVIGGEFLQL